MEARSTPPATTIPASTLAASLRMSSRSGLAPPCDSTKRRTPAPASSDTRPLNVGGRRWRHGYSASRSSRASRPIASQSPAMRNDADEDVGVLHDRPHGHHDPCRACRERDLDLVGAVDAAGHLEGRRHGARDRRDDLEVHRPALVRPIEVDEMDDRRALLHERAGDRIRPVGGNPRPARGTGPPDEARPAAPDVEARDDLGHTRPFDPTGVGPPPSPRSRRRWNETGMLPE